MPPRESVTIREVNGVYLVEVQPGNHEHAFTTYLDLATFLRGHFGKQADDARLSLSEQARKLSAEVASERAADKE